MDPQVQHMAKSPPKERDYRSWLLGGVAAVVMIAVLTRGTNSTQKRNDAGSFGVAPKPVSETELLHRSNELTANLEREQDKLKKAQKDADTARDNFHAATGQPVPGSYQPGYQEPPPPPPDPIEMAIKQREATAPFATSLVSFGKQETPSSASVKEAVSNPTVEKSVGTIPPSPPKQYTLYEGHVIESTLTNRLEGSFVGPVNCVVSVAVWTRDLQHMLIPQGSRVIRALGDAHAMPIDESEYQRLRAQPAAEPA